MAHYYFNPDIQYGRLLRSMLNQIESSDDLLRDVRELMIAMRTGTGSQAADYAEVTARFQFISNEEAQAAFNEIDSVYLKMSTDSQVSEVRSARLNLCDKLR